METKINSLIEKFGTDKKAALNFAYRTLEDEGYEVSIMNERYLTVDGKDFQIVKKGLGLVAKAF